MSKKDLPGQKLSLLRRTEIILNSYYFCIVGLFVSFHQQQASRKKKEGKFLGNKSMRDSREGGESRETSKLFLLLLAVFASLPFLLLSCSQRRNRYERRGCCCYFHTAAGSSTYCSLHLPTCPPHVVCFLPGKTECRPDDTTEASAADRAFFSSPADAPTPSNFQVLERRRCL